MLVITGFLLGPSLDLQQVSWFHSMLVITGFLRLALAPSLDLQQVGTTPCW